MDDPDKLAILTFAATEWEAETIAAALRLRDIPVFVEGGVTAGWRADTPALAKVMVFRRDLPRARLAAKEAAFTGASIDWDDVDLGAAEPESLDNPGPPPPLWRMFVIIGMGIVVVLAVALIYGLTPHKP